jgi:hypothetical protein
MAPVRMLIAKSSPGRSGDSGSGGYGSGAIGTTARYECASTRAAAAGAKPACGRAHQSHRGWTCLVDACFCGVISLHGDTQPSCWCSRSPVRLSLRRSSRGRPLPVAATVSSVLASALHQRTTLYRTAVCKWTLLHMCGKQLPALGIWGSTTASAPGVAGQACHFPLEARAGIHAEVQLPYHLSNAVCTRHPPACTACARSLSRGCDCVKPLPGKARPHGCVNHIQAVRIHRRHQACRGAAPSNRETECRFRPGDSAPIISSPVTSASTTTATAPPPSLPAAASGFAPPPGPASLCTGCAHTVGGQPRPQACRLQVSSVLRQWTHISSLQTWECRTPNALPPPLPDPVRRDWWFLCRCPANLMHHLLPLLHASKGPVHSHAADDGVQGNEAACKQYGLIFLPVTCIKCDATGCRCSRRVPKPRRHAIDTASCSCCRSTLSTSACNQPECAACQSTSIQLPCS